ncbi:hypothetical protein E2C01_076750 [Portunus trituberculatus]|uniref:Uncharacterized protein n=1 Tax=Portunus trituberculatus TaxID=210409 RepID=A0A5B7IIK3_PORTR|nr:hypothetical protein [Portunus trituberculatus]
MRFSHHDRIRSNGFKFGTVRFTTQGRRIEVLSRMPGDWNRLNDEVRLSVARRAGERAGDKR